MRVYRTRTYLLVVLLSVVSATRSGLSQTQPPANSQQPLNESITSLPGYTGQAGQNQSGDPGQPASTVAQPRQFIPSSQSPGGPPLPMTKTQDLAMRRNLPRCQHEGDLQEEPVYPCLGEDLPDQRLFQMYFQHVATLENAGKAIDAQNPPNNKDTASFHNHEQRAAGITAAESALLTKLSVDYVVKSQALDKKMALAKQARYAPGRNVLEIPPEVREISTQRALLMDSELSQLREGLGRRSYDKVLLRARDLFKPAVITKSTKMRMKSGVVVGSGETPIAPGGQP